MSLVEREWPVHMKKNVDGKIDTQYAHNKKELQAYSDLGYTDDLRNVHAADYPRLLYRVFSGNVETIKATDADHETALKADGYGRQPIAQKEAAAVQSPNGTGGDTRVAALEDQIQELKALVESLTAPASKKGKKED